MKIVILISLLVSVAGTKIFIKNNTPYQLHLAKQATNNKGPENFESQGKQSLEPHEKLQFIAQIPRSSTKSGISFFNIKIFNESELLVQLDQKVKNSLFGGEIFARAKNHKKKSPWESSREIKSLDWDNKERKFQVQFKFKRDLKGFDKLIYSLNEVNLFDDLVASDNPQHLSVVTHNIFNVFHESWGKWASNSLQNRSHWLSKDVKGSDIYAFQEAFNKKAYDEIWENSPEYKYRTQNHSEPLRPIDSGIKIFSKWPIEEERFEAFPLCKSAECLSARGVRYIKINKKGVPYHIFVTHVHWYVPYWLRKTQFTQIKRFINAQNIPQNEAVILAGDMNTYYHDRDDYNDMIETLGVCDTPSMGYPVSLDGTIDTLTDHKGIYDYVFSVNSHKRPKVVINEILAKQPMNVEAFGVWTYSDHLPRRADFSYEKSLPRKPIKTSRRNLSKN